MKRSVKYVLLLQIAFSLCVSCTSKELADPEGETAPRTPVTVTSAQYLPVTKFVELNATSTFLQNSYVKANLNGYIRSVNIQFGAFVEAGQRLFSLQTKESKALGNTINKLDPEFKFSGINYIKANVSGYIAQLDGQTGNYVQDGDQLAVISDIKSFLFLMDVPYEYKNYITPGKQVEIILPDGERLPGTVQPSMPFLDSVSQTQAVPVKLNVAHKIPRGLIAKVKIETVSKSRALSLPKAAVLSDETQSAFWVMKMANDSMAIKVPVKTGVETTGLVEIVSPVFSERDKILVTGNFGLPDTALVIVTPATR